MKILIIGSGGREHALVQTFHRKGHQIICLPGNSGTDQISLPKSNTWKTVSINSYDTLSSIALMEKVDLTVVGPELPLSEGIVDLFRQKNLAIFGPKQQAAKMESSKVWSKEFMTRYNIPTAPYFICETPQEALEQSKKCFTEWSGLVIKPDGLTAGKGVIPCDDLERAEEAIQIIMEDGKFGKAGHRIIVEKMLSGPEVSILAFCDGKSIVPMIPSQDHKRLLEGDRGPNTGGIGAYAPLSFLSKQNLKDIHQSIIEKTLMGLQEEEIDYKGVIYFGIMLTEEGPQLLEYNCRFGDPESQVVLPLLESDLAPIMLSCCQGKLSEETVRWSKKSACCVVMTSGGYPDHFQTGYEISGIQDISTMKDVFCFQAGTFLNEQGKVVTHGGRVLGITGLGKDLDTAVKNAYQAIDKVNFKGAYFRRDIAYQALAFA